MTLPTPRRSRLLSPAEPAPPLAAPGWTAREWIVLAACAALAALNLWTPFTWDQAMFAMGGEKVLEGGRLYRDYWDTKQPGIFWFFAAAIRLFGSSEESVHLLELVWFTAFAAVLQRSLRRAFTHRWGASVAALLIVGFYWAVTEDWHLTQPEGLLCFPMFLAFWYSLEGARRERGAWKAWLVAGLAAGVIGIFKLLLVAIPAACCLGAFGVRLADRRPGKMRDLALGAAILAAGVALPLLLMAAVLVRQGVWADAWYSWVVFPKEVGARIHGFPVKALRESFVWFFDRWTGLLPLALVGAWTGLRGRHPRQVTMLLIWMAACFPIVLVQRFSGWAYHAWLFLVPLGLLAAHGVDAIATPLAELRPPHAPRARRGLLALALGLLFVEPLGGAAQKAVFLAKDRFVSTPALRHKHLVRASRGGAYYRFGRETAFLHDPAARPGPIYVLGNPLVYWLSGRRQSAPRTGGILPEWTTSAEWEDAVRHIEAARTPYLYVEHHDGGILSDSHPASDPILRELATRYRELRRSEWGVWYERVAEADSAR